MTKLTLCQPFNGHFLFFSINPSCFSGFCTLVCPIFSPSMISQLSPSCESKKKKKIVLMQHNETFIIHATNLPLHQTCSYQQSSPQKIQYTNICKVTNLKVYVKRKKNDFEQGRIRISGKRSNPSPL